MTRIEISILGFLLVVGLGARLFLFFQHAQTYHEGQSLSLQVQLTQEPQLSNKGQQFAVQTPDNQAIYIKTSAVPVYHYGDALAIQGSLQVRKGDKDHMFLTLSYPKIQRKEGTHNPVIEASIFIRQQSSALFDQTLPSISSSLLQGIVFGAKEDFPTEFKDHLRSTGVLHVIAASGMNVSFFTGAVMFSLGALLKRRLAIIVSIFAVIFYSFLVGFEPSIVRASVMALIAFAASFFGRQSLGVWVLLVTGYLMLMWQPGFLFDVGFQLSFLATLGILIIGKRFGDMSAFGFLAEDIKTTISAEVATLPILLATFGQVGILSLVVNTLVLWTVPILMVLGSLSVLVGIVIPPLGSLFLICCLPFLLYFEQVVNVFGSLGWNLSVETFPWEFMLGYYLLLGAVVLGKKREHLNN